MHLIRRETLRVSVFKEHIFVTSFYIMVSECPWSPHIYIQGSIENAQMSSGAFLWGLRGNLYSRKEERDCPTAQLHLSLVLKCCPLQVRGGGGAWITHQWNSRVCCALGQ